MTTGQRIAQKRKELALSQEALGAELGVSRQSIYKWESDTALPEIDKLVILSRRFGVTVGWLLGVEEAPTAPEQNAAEAPQNELTDTQLKMVEEITNRYLAALPKPGKKRRKWPWVLAAGVLLAVGLTYYGNSMRDFEQKFSNMAYQISQVRNDVSSQVNSISYRVEEILKQQNDLTAAYGVEVVDFTPSQNSGSVTFSVYAVPKTFVDGMRAEFSVDNGHGANIKIAESVRDQNGAPVDERFETDLTCELTDDITISVVFVLPDGTRQTQILEFYTRMYSESLPEMRVVGAGFLDAYADIQSGKVTLEEFDVAVKPSETQTGWLPEATQVVSFRVGLFKNQELVAWAQEIPKDGSHWVGFDDYRIFLFSPVSLSMEIGDTVSVAAVVVDQYGRTSIYQEDPPSTLDADGKTLSWADSYDQYPDPADWHFD